MRSVFVCVAQSGAVVFCVRLQESCASCAVSAITPCWMPSDLPEHACLTALMTHTA